MARDFEVVGLSTSQATSYDGLVRETIGGGNCFRFFSSIGAQESSQIGRGSLKNGFSDLGRAITRGHELFVLLGVTKKRFWLKYVSNFQSKQEEIFLQLTG